MSEIESMYDEITAERPVKADFTLGDSLRNTESP